MTKEEHYLCAYDVFGEMSVTLQKWKAEASLFVTAN